MQAPHRSRWAAACMALGALLLAGALIAALSQSAPRRTGTNGVWINGAIAEVGTGTSVCQTRELLPAGTRALRLSVWPSTSPGPELRVTLRRHGRPIDRSTAATGANGGVAPVRPRPHDLSDVDVCFVVTSPGSGVAVAGGATPPGVGGAVVNGRAVGGSTRIDYLPGGRASWWSHAGTVMSRIGMGRGSWGGTWTAWLAIALVLSAIALAGWIAARTIVRDPRPGERLAERADADRAVRRVPPVAWAILAIALCNAAAWSLLTPAFQVPDEQTHVAYAQQLAETGHPPVKRSSGAGAPELAAILRDVRFGSLRARSYAATVTSPLQQRQLERDLRAGLSRRGDGDAGPADPEPPLYYALEAIPYRLAVGASLLDRMALMRLLSALMAGGTALFAYLFVRECLPRRPWAWSVGGLGVAFAPVLGFVSGAVNPDALLFLVCAALFYCLARAFRRGLTPRLAVVVGAVMAAGMVGKINFYGIAPGAVLAVALAARASAGGWNRRWARLTGIAVGVALAPFVLLSALDALVWERALILARTPAEAPTSHGDLGGQFSYLWQVFLPRLPGQTPAFPYYPPYKLLAQGFLGRFGWLAVSFPAWAYAAGMAVLGVVGALAARTLVAERAAVRRRAPELIGYLAMTGGLLLLLGLVTLRGWAPGAPGALQGRYLLPLLALFGAVLTLAVRGAGERWGRALGGALVVLAVGWTVFSQFLMVTFFYG